MTAWIEAALQAFADGEIVVVTDDDDREGEGDLVVAASRCTAKKMAFIIRHTSGIVCAPIALEDARRLRLDPMVLNNYSAHTTAFTVSVDYRPDNGTGISAEERASCCRALANPNTGAGDFCRPGHIFPLIAKEGGVLMRSGHTEAAVDLCRLAGLEPVGVISELMNDDGSVMKGPQVAAFADKHKLKQVTIVDLISFRQARETLIERVPHLRHSAKLAVRLATDLPRPSLAGLGLGEVARRHRHDGSHGAAPHRFCFRPNIAYEQRPRKNKAAGCVPQRASGSVLRPKTELS
ncbi:3,4-dihydroxy-2-butanone 4-phosphate synthase [Bradyrhizobium sp. RT6a]